MNRNKIIQRVIFQIGFGGLLLFVWHIIQRPKLIINNNSLPNSIDDPSTQLLINFFSWLFLISSVVLLISGIAGLIKLLFWKRVGTLASFEKLASNNPSILRECKTSNGLLYYFFSHAICVKCAQSINAAKLISLIDFKEVRKSQPNIRKGNPDAIFDQGKFQLLVLKTNNWLVIADNWFYTLYHEARKRPIFEKLYQQFEVFTFTTGDSDWSYDFLFADRGKVIREFVVTGDSKISKDFGVTFPVELPFDKKRLDFEVIIPIAYHLGINLDEVDVSEIEYYEYVL
ncbi:MAG: hypothetical protein AAF806_23600 [Bacteroidota bacterium]